MTSGHDIQQGKPVKILVAVDGEATQEIMKDILTDAGFDVLIAGTGREALSVLEKEHPRAAYLDVALPQVLGFEVCEIIKKSSQLKEIKVILVSSIYDKTRYKREPSSLYGADDYIERHHIHDSLVAKLNKLLVEQSECGATELALGSVPQRTDASEKNGDTSPRDRLLTAGSTDIQSPQLPVPDAGVEAVIEPASEESGSLPSNGSEGVSPSGENIQGFVQQTLEAVYDPSVAGPVELSLEPAEPISSMSNESVMSSEEKALHEEAKRFARLIVSDIALYNQKAIEEGIESGNVEELLKDDMLEAEKLYQVRIPKEIRGKTNYLKEALHDLVERKKKIMKQDQKL